MKFTGDQWTGNRWASVEIYLVEASCFLSILFHLSATYHFAFPPVIDILDGFVAEFTILDSKAIMVIDNWTFSIAFENVLIRDQVLAELRSLHSLYFGA